MLRHYPNRFVMAFLMLAAMLASTGSVSSKTPSDPVPTEFAAMDAKGAVSVDDATNPTMLSFDLRAGFRLGPNSNGINPLAEHLMLHLQYGGAVGPMYIVAVPAGCFTQTGNGYQVRMQDFHDCDVSIQALNVFQSPNEILPFIELVPAVNKFDLRLTPGLNGTWDFKVNIGFLTSNPNVPIAGVIAILRSPTMVKLEVGDDRGEVAIGKIEFKGDN